MRSRRAALAAAVAVAVAVATALVATARAAAPGELRVWMLDRGEARAAGAGGGGGETEPSLPLGSLVKPFLAEAWASAHPDEPTPRLRCAGGAQCWRPAGHGELGLARAVEVSCNAYFRALASATPRELVEQTLRGAGFTVVAPLTPDAALGLAAARAGSGSVRATPARLLAAYAALAREPWSRGDAVRQEVLAGLASAARGGTAAALGARGLRAKTGTVAALDGAPLATSGFTLAFDESGWAVLALLERGTGREAAAALAARLPELRPGAVVSTVAVRASRASSAPRDASAAPARSPWRWDPASGAEPPPVRVSLLGALAPRELSARNLGPAPAPGPRGFVGPRGGVGLGVGDALGPSLWELVVPSFRLRRVVEGSIMVAPGRGGALRPIVETPAAGYVSGVVAAELPGSSSEELRPALGAAVLRFLMRGARHDDAEVCDTTHCAWFVGRGPRVVWIDGRHPLELAAPEAGRTGGGERVLEPLAAPAWERAEALARGEDGPSLWSADCGGMPRSPHALWGNGDRRVWVCPRHGTTPRAPWSREWPGAALARAFGAPVRHLALVEPDGVWTLRVSLAGGEVRELRYDDAHRAVAEVLGWDALPSPASTLERAGDGYRVNGFGHGHRVGLCLAP